MITSAGASTGAPTRRRSMRLPPPPPGEPGVNGHDGADELHDGKGQDHPPEVACVHRRLLCADPAPPARRAAVCTQSLSLLSIRRALSSRQAPLSSPTPD